MSQRLDWKTPPREPEAIRWPRIHAIVVGTVLVFAVGVLATWLAYRARAAHLNPAGPSVPAVLGRETIGELEQAPFLLERRAYERRAEALARLRSYGWIDRRRGLARVPIDVAIDELVAAQGRAPVTEGRR